MCTCVLLTFSVLLSPIYADYNFINAVLSISRSANYADDSFSSHARERRSVSKHCPSFDICNRYHRITLFCKLQDDDKDACGSCQIGYSDALDTFTCRKGDNPAAVSYADVAVVANVDVVKLVREPRHHRNKARHGSGIGPVPFIVLIACVVITAFGLLVWMFVFRRRVASQLDDESEPEEEEKDVTAVNGRAPDKTDGVLSRSAQLYHYKQRKVEISGDDDAAYQLGQTKDVYLRSPPQHQRYSREHSAGTSTIGDDLLDDEAFEDENATLVYEYSGPAAQATSEVTNPLYKPPSPV